MPWNPEQYHKFRAQRAAPFEDLVKLIRVRPGMRAIDLGCGTGELTARLADLLPDSDVLGLDSSAEMLGRAEAFVRPGLRFEQGTIESVAGEWDLIFSHAALQWVDDHQTLISRLFGLLKPGGQLVVQMPSNHTHYSHQVVRELAAQEPFATALGGWSRSAPVLPIDAYAELLFACGGEDITVFEKIYPHILPDADAIAEWTSGTLLVPYMERLPSALHAAFMDAYRTRLRARWPQGPVFYGFRRTLFAAIAPQGE
ncbi:MAG: methyltransferase domain-containing protein [Chloroflexota bacterium]|nr:MAG: trans-aconitate methyltransferase [Chloroflexota bacterium]